MDASKKEEYDKQMQECIKRNPCPHEGEQISEITPEEDQHLTYHCRKKRYIECALEPEEN